MGVQVGGSLGLGDVAYASGGLLGRRGIRPALGAVGSAVLCETQALGAHYVGVPRIQEVTRGPDVVLVPADTDRPPSLLDPCPPHLPQSFRPVTPRLSPEATGPL